MKMKKMILILMLGLLWSGTLRAQDCECYAPTRQTAVRMMEKKEYAKALKLLRAADACPDKPSDNDLAAKMQECRRAIRKEQERIEAERNRPATPPDDDSSAGEIVIPLVPRQGGNTGGSEKGAGSGRNGNNVGNRGRDLSARGTANCYIVSSPGTYSFPTVKGNSWTSVGNVSRAEVLWESFGTATAPSKGDIIQSVSYTTGSGPSEGTITFSTPSYLRNGNAVIAAKDAYGTILWSWHIWVCSGYDPVAMGQVYYNNAGTMMDRNLGATSATPGDVGALGLLYQWGRKDPFLASGSISSTTRAESTISWPSPVTSSSHTGTIDYAVEHPTTVIYSSSSTDNDWVYTGKDNTLWQTTKTINDPCPPGWRVPDGGDDGVWSTAVGSHGSFTGSINKGMNFSGKFGSSSTIWYPAAGSLEDWDGRLGFDSFGMWWSCTTIASGAKYLCLSYDGEVFPSYGHGRAYGCSVRCLQE